MRKPNLVSVTILSLFILTALTLDVHAQNDDPWVMTEDLNDNSEDYFESPGETVRIVAYAGSSFVPYQIRVLRSPGGQSYDTPYTGSDWELVETIDVEDPGLVTYDCDDISSPGQTWWKAQIWKDSVEYQISGIYFVIPEVPLGVTILTALFAATAVRRFKH